MKPDQTLTVTQAAKYLGVSVYFFKRYLGDTIPQVVRGAGMWRRYYRSDLDRARQQLRIDPNEQAEEDV